MNAKENIRFFWHCLRCKWDWQPRKINEGKKPRLCPKCHSAYWDVPKKETTEIKSTTTSII
jgi:Zn finger protein HypA/HybF involved in hydrogenase expression